MTSLRLAIVLACLLSGSAAAQTQLPPQLSPASRDTISRLLDSARVTGLPTEPLVARAHEGVLKRVSEDRIVSAVRSLLRRQHEARVALPSGARAATLAAGVSALQAGVSAQTVRRLSSVPRISETDLAVSLVTVADLVASRVPAEAAASAIEELLRRGASEQTMAAFRLGIADDIRSGRAPSAALASQTTTFVRQLEARPASARARPPETSP